MTTLSVTDFSSWPIELRLFLCSGWITLIIFNFTFRTYIQKVHLAKMIRSFSQSPYIQKMAPILEKQGHITQRSLINFVFGAIRYSPKMIEAGYVSAQDVHHFPPYFKVLLYTQNAITKIYTVWILIVITILMTINTIKSW